MPDLVVVFGPNNEEKIESVANARDLVLNVPGWSYGNGKKASPVDSSPYAVIVPPPGTPEPAKAVLDRYGSGSDALAAPAPAAPVIFKAPQAPAPEVAAPATPAPTPVVEVAAPAPVVEAAPAPAAEPVVVEDAVLEAVTDGDAPAKPERQKRAPKAPE